MQFAESQIYGRTGKCCIAWLKDFSCRRRSKIADRDGVYLKLFLSLLKSEEPRVVFLQQSSSVVMIADACYERDARDWVCGLGGVLVDQLDDVKLFFSCQLTEQLRVPLGELRKKQIIFEAGTLCAFLAYCLCMDLFCGRMSFLYVNNESTKFSYMKGSSENLTVDAMTQVFVEVETHVKTICWLSSCSKIADEPSRGDCRVLNEMNFTHVSKDATNCRKSLCMSIGEKRGKMAGHALPILEK